MKKDKPKKRIVLAILSVVLLLLSGLCFLQVINFARMLPSQRMAERWQGEGEQSFGQVSCFLAVDEKIDLNQITKFRYAILDALREAGFEADTDTRLFRDAWCTTGKLPVTSALGKGEANIIAVGGHFFAFHPIRLLSGSYISEDDLMQDRVLLDEELAWMLFGGTELQGMEMKINGIPFVVAGVIEREQDFASKSAYTAGMGLYMSFDAYSAMTESGASCYELVLAEPVEGFTRQFVKEEFPIGQGEVVVNSGRYSFGRLLKLVGKYGTRSMQTLGVVYPYWENAARSVEDWCELLLLLGLAFLAFPLVYGAALLVRLLKRGGGKLSEDVLPKLKDSVEEAVRKRQRRAWEKKHPGET